jgi:hypothetical protein
MIRTFMDLCRSLGLSFLIIFIDLSKAFDRAIRELVMGAMKGADLDTRSLFRKLGLTDVQADELADFIDANGPLLTQMGVDAKVVQLIRSLHSFAWFNIDGLESFIVSRSGGRQGCKLGSIVFNIAYALALSRLRSALVGMGLVLRITRCDEGTFFSLPQSSVKTGVVGDPDDNEVAASEVTYVDDEALLITSTSPSTLVQDAPRIAETICEIFSSLGMVVNWDPGKTEAFLSLRGKRSVVLKSEVWAAEVPGISIDPKCGAERLRLVHEYKHLGSSLADDGNNNVEAIRRSRSGLSAYAPIAIKVFGSKSISIRLRIELAATLIFSRLLYNVHVWSIMSRCAYTKLNSVYMRVLRRIAGLSWTGSASDCVSNFTVRQRLGVPALDSLIRQRRLLYFSTMLRSDAHALKSMLSILDQRGVPLSPWTKLLYDDLRSLRDFHGAKLCELNDPSSDIKSWVRLATKYPEAWSQLVKSFVVFSSVSEVKGGVQPAGIGPCFTCKICPASGASFPTLKSLQAHMRSQHGVTNALKRFIDDSGVCPGCCTLFASRSRLLAHISERRNRGRSAISCNALLETGIFPEVSGDVIAACDATDRAARCDARKHGHSQPVVQHASAKRARIRGVAGIGLKHKTRLLQKTPEVEVRRAHVRALLLDVDGLPRKRRRISSKMKTGEVVVQNLRFTSQKVQSMLAVQPGQMD